MSDKNFSVQCGIKNYLPEAEKVLVDGVPLQWQSGPEHPRCILAYITEEEAAHLAEINLHNSDHVPGEVYGPAGIPSFNSAGSGFGGDDADEEAEDQDTAEDVAAAAQDAASRDISATDRFVADLVASSLSSINLDKEGNLIEDPHKAFDFDLASNLDDWFQDINEPTTMPISHAIGEFLGFGKEFVGVDEFGNPIVNVTKSFDPFAMVAGFFGTPILGAIVDAIVPDPIKVTLGRAEAIFGPKTAVTEVAEREGGDDADRELADILPQITTIASPTEESLSEFEQLVEDALSPETFEFFKMPEFNLLSNDFGSMTFDLPKGEIG